MSGIRLTFKEMCARFDVTPAPCGIVNISNCFPRTKTVAPGGMARAKWRG
jgi:hypothetical protein